jgi:hypothetical protein
MKSDYFALGLIFAVFSALMALPIGAVTEGSNVLIIAGILLVFLADCRRTLKPCIPLGQNDCI